MAYAMVRAAKRQVVRETSRSSPQRPMIGMRTLARESPGPAVLHRGTLDKVRPNADRSLTTPRLLEAKVAAVTSL